jgi:hypothetical protein
MKKNKTTLFSTLKKTGAGLLTLFFTAVFFFGGQFSIAELNGDTPSGDLQGGAFLHWIHEALANPPASQKEALTNYSLKKANMLADTSGNKIVHTKALINNESQVGIGIGTQNPEELLHIEGISPVVEILANTGNPEIQLAKNGTHGAIYFDNTTNKLHLWNGINIIEFQDGANDGSPKITNVNGTLTVKGKNVVLSDQDCTGQNSFVYGINVNGEIQCQFTKPDNEENTCYFDETTKTWNNCNFATPTPTPTNNICQYDEETKRWDGCQVGD